MSLLEKALKTVRLSKHKEYPTDKEHVELAVALFTGRVTLSQAKSALEVKDRNESMTVYYRLGSVLTRAAQEGQIKIVVQ